jgi:hypothetical protein
MPRPVLLAALAALALPAAGAQGPQTASVDILAPLLRQDPRFVSHQSETFITLSMAASLASDPRLARAASHLAPSTLRVGGTSADFVNYTLDHEEVHYACVPNHDYPFPLYPGLNFSLFALEAMASFCARAGFSLVIDVNELTGRSCGSGGCTNTTWDTRSLRAFLEHIRDADLPVEALEMGNELSGSRGPFIAKDFGVLSALLDDVFGTAQGRPALLGPGDACNARTAALFPLVAALPGRRGVSFHDYSVGDALSVERLRTLGSAGDGCYDAWSAGPRTEGVELWITETAATAAPVAALEGFGEGFFSLASIGAYARLGLSRWARTQLTDANDAGTDGCFNFGLLHPHADQWDVAADFWVLALHQQVVGSGVLNCSSPGGNSSVLVYAYCGVAAGAVVVAAANVGAEAAALSLVDAVGAPLRAAPRLEWVLTAPGGNLSATAPLLNGATPPLRLEPDGGLPPMPPAEVPAGGAQALLLPPWSQAFFVLLDAGAAACK